MGARSWDRHDASHAPCSSYLAVVGLRPAHEPDRLRHGRQRRDAVAFQRLLELTPFRVGERGLARLADRLRALSRIGDRAALDQGIEDAQEIAFAALVRFAIALDQTSAQGDLEREARVALCRARDRSEPAA